MSLQHEEHRFQSMGIAQLRVRLERITSIQKLREFAAMAQTFASQHLDRFSDPLFRDSYLELRAAALRKIEVLTDTRTRTRFPEYNDMPVSPVPSSAVIERPKEFEQKREPQKERVRVVRIFRGGDE